MYDNIPPYSVWSTEPSMTKYLQYSMGAASKLGPAFRHKQSMENQRQSYPLTNSYYLPTHKVDGCPKSVLRRISLQGMEAPKAKCLNNIVGNHLQAGAQTKIPLSNGAMNRKGLRSPNWSNVNLVIHLIHMEWRTNSHFHMSYTFQTNSKEELDNAKFQQNPGTTGKAIKSCKNTAQQQGDNDNHRTLNKQLKPQEKLEAYNAFLLHTHLVSNLVIWTKFRPSFHIPPQTDFYLFMM